MKRFLIGAAEIELKINKAKSRNYDDGFTQTMNMASLRPVMGWGWGWVGFYVNICLVKQLIQGNAFFLHPLISKVCTFPRSLCELRVCASQCVKCAVQALDLLDALP